MFKLPPEHHEIGRHKELDETIDRHGKTRYGLWTAVNHRHYRRQREGYLLLALWVIMIIQSAHN